MRVQSTRKGSYSSSIHALFSGDKSLFSMMISISTLISLTSCAGFLLLCLKILSFLSFQMQYIAVDKAILFTFLLNPLPFNLLQYQFAIECQSQALHLYCSQSITPFQTSFEKAHPKNRWLRSSKFDPLHRTQQFVWMIPRLWSLSWVRSLSWKVNHNTNACFG